MTLASNRVRWIGALLLAAALLGIRPATAEEIWLYDNTRIFGLVKGVTEGPAVLVLLPTGAEQKVPLENIVAIRFLGRNPLLVQSGTQEFRFINGGNLRGQIQDNQGDVVRLQTAMAGLVPVALARVKGFVALPLAGFSGRKAEELVEGDRGRLSRALDVVLDNKGSTYSCVLRKLDKTTIELDHEDLLQRVVLKILYLAGVRLADATRDPVKPWAQNGEVQVRLWGRDESVVQGQLNKVHLGKWKLMPLWDPASPLDVDLEEIALVQVLGGRVQYLSQLTPVKVAESTALSPPQPYRMDRSCQGDRISIAGKRYPWGIGVHANSELTFKLNGKFTEFRSDVGIATRMGDRGSVVFSVLGDGKELYKSPVIRGTATMAPGAKAPSDKAENSRDGKPQAAGKREDELKPVEVVVPVAGVKQLTLKVTDADDLDLGDVANWGSARVLR